MTSLVVFAVSSTTRSSMADAEPGSPRAGARVAAAVVASSTARAASGPVAIVDQRHGILIFDVASRNWNSEVPWSWAPPGKNMKDWEKDNWNNLSEIRFRSYGGRNTLLVTASGGRAATVDYATRRVTWTEVVGGNPHSMELLPTGAVVIASSTGDRLTAYGKGGHEPSDTLKFPDAHAVLWDSARHQLWALGGSKLCAYHMTGSATSPRFGPTPSKCVNIPAKAHDLSPVYGSSAVSTNPAEMWFSTTHGVYIYNINRGTTRRAGGYISQESIKSVGNQPGGLVITAQVKQKTAHSDGTWGDQNVWLYNPDGSYVGNRFRRGAAIYKARPVVWERR